MEVDNVVAGRPVWYDRAPLIVFPTYVGASLAPHALTQRSIYTVPTARSALWEYLNCYIQRDTAAAPAVAANVFINYTPSGGASGQITRGLLIANTVFAIDRLVTTPAAVLLAGDALQTQTSDNSTGGTVSYIVTEKLTEFSA